MYPFVAVTGQENAKKALLCALTSEDISSVLIIGGCGTAKSTLVRSIESLLDDKTKIFTIPQNITYDRLLGMIDLEKAVIDGTIQIIPGILAEGDNQIVYADNINLMDPGLVKNILNIVETGYYILEREGLSKQIRTRFTFLATMDPKEGEISMSQLDHFDLCIRVDPIEESELRAEIIRRNFQFEFEGEDFILNYGPQTESLKQNIHSAKDRLPSIILSDNFSEIISSLCVKLRVSGQRGDIAAARTAKVLAALDGRDSVILDDIKLAALFTLEHRRGDTEDQPPLPPPPPPPQNERKDDDKKDQKNDSESSEKNDSQDLKSNPQQNNEKETEKDEKPFNPPPLEDQISDVGATFAVIRYLDEKSRQTTQKQKSGRRTRVISSDSSGHYHTYRILSKNRNDIALDATLRAAAPYQITRERKGLAISVKKTDLREKVREKKVANTILFLVDASGSMGANQRMVAVKGAILSLLTDAYQKRDRIGLMIFRGTEAELLLPPTRSSDLAVKMLRTIPTGGMTPLTTGITEAYNLFTRGKFAMADENKSIVILTDGRVNVPVNNGSPSEELSRVARDLAESRVKFVVIDTESGFPHLGRALQLAGDLNASYYRLEELDSNQIAHYVHNSIYQTNL
ncbi:MAG: VWA domain-containing protein [Methanospirillum sp.]|nr:VWA domain-containing protein [Methanospirillum sp.]